VSAVDRVLGRVTMYRLVTLALGAILLAALGLSVLGPVQQDPWAVAVTAVVAVGVSVLASRACGALWRTRVHTESAVITGLILALLFWPQLTVGGVAVVAGAAALASLSKFVVAVRSRHVLNPAAAGALVAGLVAVPFGGFPAAWWMATPALLPVVALAGLVVVLRTRRGALVLTYLAAALAVLMPRLVAGGSGPVEALRTALESYPLVFAAAFMLTEPLTLPPRRRQQLAEAALVGALTVAPFSLGVLYASPELALVVGNVLAFTVGQRRAVHLRVLAHRMVTPGIREVAFASDAAVRFRPGQWIELHVPHPSADARGSRRVFSLATPPDHADGLAVAFRLTEAPSSFKRALSALPAGGLVRATGVGGDFVLPKDPSVPLLLVAGGIGITPFVSQLAALARDAERRDVVVVLLMGPGDQPAYADVLVDAGARVVVVSPERPSAMPAGWTYVAGPTIDEAALSDAVPDARDRVAYVSGSPGMVDHTRRLLRRAGVRRVRTDAFSGY
jgi:ferredoxin-NADP reductase